MACNSTHLRLMSKHLHLDDIPTEPMSFYWREFPFIVITSVLPYFSPSFVSKQPWPTRSTPSSASFYITPFSCPDLNLITFLSNIFPKIFLNEINISLPLIDERGKRPPLQDNNLFLIIPVFSNFSLSFSLHSFFLLF